MKRPLLLPGIVCAFCIAILSVSQAQAQCPPGYVWSRALGCMPVTPRVPPRPPGYVRPCPPGYIASGPRGCMPAGPQIVVPPPVVRPCPPGTIFRAGACRRVAPPPSYGITITPPTIIIRP